MIRSQLPDRHLAGVLTSRCSSIPSAPPSTLRATTFLPPGTGSAELVPAVRSAALALDEAPPTAANYAVALADRERDLLRLLSQGVTNREIAPQLHLGPDAIKKNASAPSTESSASEKPHTEAIPTRRRGPPRRRPTAAHHAHEIGGDHGAGWRPS